MQRREHNLLAIGGGIRRRIYAPTYVTLFTLLLTFLPKPALAGDANVGALMQMGGFKRLVLTIATVNRVMRDAAENPQDDFRRKNVQVAVSMLPAAIIGLANEFKGGNLHDSDLPRIQALLGGFVDVNAADNYKKFIKNPDKSLIPQVGKGFPKEVLDQANKGASPVLVMDESASKRGPSSLKSPSNSASVAGSFRGSENGATDTKELADLGGGRILPKGKGQSSGGLAFDEGASKSSSAPSSGSPGSQGSQGSQGSPSQGQSGSTGYVPSNPFLQGAVNDLATIESKFGGAPVIERKETQDTFKDEDLKLPEEKAPKKEGRRSRISSPQSYKMTVKPKYWRSGSLFQLLPFIITTAHAEGCPGGCDKQKGGGGGGGGGGGDAAGILFGIAAIIQAVAPMVVASIQASADKDIARTNAAAQITMTQISSDTSKYLANQQKDIALTQSQVAQQISAQNNQGVTDRLNMQLAQLDKARGETNQLEREKRATEDKYNQQRIALAEKQANDNLALAKQTLSAQLTQAGLASGVSNTRNSGDRLSVDRLSGVASRTTQATGQSLTLGSPFGTRSGAQLASTNVAGGAGKPQLGFKAKEKLLAAVNPDQQEEELKLKELKKKKLLAQQKGKPKGRLTMLGSGGVMSVGDRIAKLLSKGGLADGSTPNRHVVAASEPIPTSSGDNDLNRFFQETRQKQDSSFVDYSAQQRAASADGNGGNAEGVRPRTPSGAYNSPELPATSGHVTNHSSASAWTSVGGFGGN